MKIDIGKIEKVNVDIGVAKEIEYFHFNITFRNLVNSYSSFTLNVNINDFDKKVARVFYLILLNEEEDRLKELEVIMQKGAMLLYSDENGDFTIGQLKKLFVDLVEDVLKE